MKLASLRYPLLFPFVSAVLGITAAGSLRLYLPEKWLLPVAVLTLLAFLFSRRHLFHVNLSLALCIWGNLSLHSLLAPAVHVPGTDRPETTVCVVEGVIAKRPEGRPEGEVIQVRSERISPSEQSLLPHGLILLTVREGRTGFCTGDRIRFEAKLRQPRNYGLPGEFDRVRRLALLNVIATGSVASPTAVELLPPESGPALSGRIDRLARRLGATIAAEVPGEEGAILRALLLGDRGGISRETDTAFARAGVNHILSISGFHVAIVGLCVYQILFFLARRSERLALRFDLRRLVPLAGLPAVVFYLFLSGAAPATLRSVLMIAVAAVVLLLEQETDSLNVLLVAAVVMLGVSPWLAYDISFQLSFLAVWGLVVLTPLFLLKAPDTRVGGKLLLAMAASVAAIVATAVPVAYHFHRLSLAGIFANLVIVPLLGYGAVVTGLSALLIHNIFPIGGGLLLEVAGFLVGVSVRIVKLFAQMPVPEWYPSAALMAIYLGAVLAVTLFRSTKQRLAAVGASATIILLVTVAGYSSSGDRRLHIDVLSVGQGESTLFRMPDGKTMLVDGGGNYFDSGFDVGDRLVAPALHALGVRRIDRMVLTHQHPDHAEGLRFLAREFEIGEFVTTRFAVSSPSLAPLLGELNRKGIKVRCVDAGSPLENWGGVVLATLSPPAPGWDGVENDANEDSLVFRLEYGTISFLFTGDIGPFTEYRLVRERRLLRSTMLKVAHHGSRFSTTEKFLASVAPTVSVVSAGYGNRFGLPSGETLKRLREAGVDLFRTDRQGTIMIESDGSNWSVQTPFAGGLTLNGRE